MGLSFFDLFDAFAPVGAEGIGRNCGVLDTNLGDSFETVLKSSFFYHELNFSGRRNLTFALVLSGIASLALVDTFGIWPKALGHRIGTDDEWKGAIVSGKSKTASCFFHRTNALGIALFQVHGGAAKHHGKEKVLVVPMRSGSADNKGGQGLPENESGDTSKMCAKEWTWIHLVGFHCKVWFFCTAVRNVLLDAIEFDPIRWFHKYSFFSR